MVREKPTTEERHGGTHNLNKEVGFWIWVFYYKICKVFRALNVGPEDIFTLPNKTMEMLFDITKYN